MFLIFLACTPGSDSLSNEAATTLAPQVLEAAHPMLRDAADRRWGPVVAEDAVWPAQRRWYELDPAPGLAWGANSGLTWDEKYRAWVDALPTTPSDDGHPTAELTTPWGTTLPLNRLECAETAILLRATFAAWHQLPFYLSGYSPTLGANVYYGHFGMLDFAGNPVPWSPDFDTYADHTASWNGLDWPDDTGLEALSLTVAHDDLNAFLGPDAYTGAYLDELHLNKKAARLMLRLLTDFGSIHLAHSENLFDLEPEVMEPGDVLLHRWQPQGVGHTMVLKEVTPLTTHVEVEILSGNMPRVQPKWLSAPVSRGYFTHRNAGSAEIQATTGLAYVEFGGGLKRWREPVVVNGRWANQVPVADRDGWVDPDDDAALTARIDVLEQLLGDPSPEGQRDALLAAIDEARANLASHPSSCANRERRERAFDELYELMESHWGWSRAETDRTYRTLSDYVFPELDYTASPSCCWNSSTPAMHDAILDHAAEELALAEQQGTCVQPTPFEMTNSGYAPFEAHATALGVDWVDWSADEDCPQAGAAADVEVQAPFTAWCDLEEPTDPVDPVDPGPGTSPEPSDEGGSQGCGCNDARANGVFYTMLAGLVLVGRRKD